MLSLFQHLWLSGWSAWIQASDGVKMFEPRGKKMLCVQTSGCSSHPSSCCFPCKLADPSRCSGQSSWTPGGGNRANFQDSCMDAFHIYDGLAQCVCFLQWEMLDLFLVDKPTACGQQVQPEHTEHIIFFGPTSGVSPLDDISFGNLGIFLLCSSREWPKRSVDDPCRSIPEYALGRKGSL